MHKFSTLVISVALAFLSILVLPKDAETIVFEAEGFSDIIEPMRVVQNDSQVSGNAFVELPLGSGQGWRNQGSGEVSYRLEVKKTGEYILWARTLWKDGCTNALFVKPNDDANFVFGNDSIFGQWHWVKGQPMSLEKGVNFIQLANHSDGVAIDKFILTDDPLYLPEGLGQGITRFYDGFAGCDGDNTGSWDIVKGNWRVIPSIGESAGGVNDALAQWDQAGGTVLGGFRTWENYDVEVKVMQSRPGAIALIIFYQDENNKFQLVAESTQDSGELRIEHWIDGICTILATQEYSLSFDLWYTVGLKRVNGQLVAYIDEKSVLHTPWPTEFNKGKIGLSTHKTMGVYFDNIEVKFHEN